MHPFPSVLKVDFNEGDMYIIQQLEMHDWYT